MLWDMAKHFVRIRNTPAPSPEPEQLGTTEQIVAILQNSRSSLNRLVKHDPIMKRAVRRIGPHSTRYSLAVVAEFLRSRTGQRADAPEAALAARRSALDGPQNESAPTGCTTGTRR